MEDVYLRARSVRVAVFDVDGVLTDGRLYYGPQGEALKAFDVRDGHGMKMLQASGVALAIITSRRSDALARRAENLGVDYVFQGVEDKLAAFRGLLVECDVKENACAYVGDDWVDLPVLLRCGLAVVVPEAPSVVRERAHYVTRAAGGRGAVREVCELIMRAQGTFTARLGAYLT